jgi:hypothetical protein
VKILPVLLNSTKMPRPNQLPPELNGFEHIGAFKMRSGREFPEDVRLLAVRVAEIGNIDLQDYPAGVRSFRTMGLVSATVGHMSTDAEVLHQIDTAKDLLIVMNDGRGFLDAQAERILLRNIDSKKQTRVVFLHPDSDYIRLDAFLTKVDKDLNAQVSDIGRGYRALYRAAEESPIQIRGSREILPVTYVITENYAFMSSYLCRGGGTLPIFRFAADSREPEAFYKRLRNDAEKVFAGATPLEPPDFTNVRSK